MIQFMLITLQTFPPNQPQKKEKDKSQKPPFEKKRVVAIALFTFQKTDWKRLKEKAITLKEPIAQWPL